MPPFKLVLNQFKFQQPIQIALAQVINQSRQFIVDLIGERYQFLRSKLLDPFASQDVQLNVLGHRAKPLIIRADKGQDSSLAGAD